MADQKSAAASVIESVKLPKLPYAYDALMPYIDAQTMELHYDKHHKGYTNKFKVALAKLSEKEVAGGIDKLVKYDSIASLPAELQGDVRNNGGGYINHTLFWNNMTKSAKQGGQGGVPPTEGSLFNAITATFESFDNFQTKFEDAAKTQFGSGWAWLVYNGENEKVEVIGTPNQEGPHNYPKMTALLGLDVWEHAYYLKYKNARPAYVSAFWNVVNWDEVQRRYAACKGKGAAL